MFRFVINYLGVLKHVPRLPWLWDSLMAVWNFAFHPTIPTAIDRIEKEVSGWEGVTVTLHRYGGRQFNYRGREIGHIHSNGMADILFDRRTKERLLLSGRAKNHHTFPESGWVSVTVRDDESQQNVLALLRLRKEVLARQRRFESPILP